MGGACLEIYLDNFLCLSTYSINGVEAIVLIVALLYTSNAISYFLNEFLIILQILLFLVLVLLLKSLTDVTLIFFPL